MLETNMTVAPDRAQQSPETLPDLDRNEDPRLLALHEQCKRFRACLHRRFEIGRVFDGLAVHAHDDVAFADTCARRVTGALLDHDAALDAHLLALLGRELAHG